MAKGKKTGGRRPGSPNRATADVRACIALIAQRNVEKLERWIGDIEDPAKRAAMLLDLFEYHIPKLARSDVTVTGDFKVSIVDPTRRGPA